MRYKQIDTSHGVPNKSVILTRSCMTAEKTSTFHVLTPGFSVLSPSPSQPLPGAALAYNKHIIYSDLNLYIDTRTFWCQV